MRELTECETKGRWKTRYLADQNGQIVQKECRKCHEMKSLTEFYPKTDCLGARRSECNECELSQNRQYHRSDKTRSAARKRKWRDANWEKNRETVRAWYNANKEAINERRRSSGHPYLKRRKERIESLPNKWTNDEKEITLSFFGGCALTGRKSNIQFDHVIPVYTGHGGTVAWNMLPLSAELNQSKSKKHIVDWFYEVKDRYELSEDRFLNALEYLANVRSMELDEFVEYIDWCHENINQGE